MCIRPAAISAPTDSGCARRPGALRPSPRAPGRRHQQTERRAPRHHDLDPARHTVRHPRISGAAHGQPDQMAGRTGRLGRHNSDPREPRGKIHRPRGYLGDLAGKDPGAGSVRDRDPRLHAGVDAPALLGRDEQDCFRFAAEAGADLGHRLADADRLSCDEAVRGDLAGTRADDDGSGRVEGRELEHFRAGGGQLRIQPASGRSLRTPRPFLEQGDPRAGDPQTPAKLRQIETGDLLTGLDPIPHFRRDFRDDPRCGGDYGVTLARLHERAGPGHSLLHAGETTPQGGGEQGGGKAGEQQPFVRSGDPQEIVERLRLCAADQCPVAKEWASQHDWIILPCLGCGSTDSPARVGLRRLGRCRGRTRLPFRGAGDRRRPHRRFGGLPVQ